MTDAQIIEVVARRLQGESWNRIGDSFAMTGQKLRRHMKGSLFPTRKKK